MEKGYIHLYTGEGKGKTTAAMGLALRALGCGLRVTVVQFLKDGTSGELAPLRRLGARICTGRPGTKFVFQMNEEEKAEVRALHNAQLTEALETPCDLLVLDEACAALSLGMVEEDLLRRAVLERPAGREVVVTGRDPVPWLVAAADYHTDMQCRRHPYQKGVQARKGVEY